MSLLLMSLLFLFSKVKPVEGMYSCRSNSECEDSSLQTYNCQFCQPETIGSLCPDEDTPECQGCTVISQAVTPHTFYLNTAGPPVMFSDYQTLFTFTAGCQTPPICSTVSSVPEIESTSLAEIQVDVSTLLSGEIIINCDFGYSSAQVAVPINVVCGFNSTALQPSWFSTTQTVALLLDATPAFNFVPYTSTVTQCPLMTTKAVTDPLHPVLSTPSPNFEPEIAGNKLLVVASGRYARRTLTFTILFEAAGGAKSFVDATLITQCSTASVPLDIADFPSQQVEVGSPSVYYQAPKISPIIADCAPLNYFVGSSTDHRDTPASLSPLVLVQGGLLKIAPLDTALKITHTFYLWMELPDSAITSIGPINLMVGCSNYLNPTLVQDTSLVAQQLIGSQGQPNRLIFQQGESNIDQPGHYRLEFKGFKSTKPSLCSPVMKQYQVSSTSDSLSAVSSATLEPFSEGDPGFKVTLDTSEIGTFSFYVHGQDTETRWTNTATSSIFTFEITCGSEILSTSRSIIEQVFNQGNWTPKIYIANSVASYFVSSEPACPVATFSFFSDAGLTASWSDPRISISGTTSNPILSIINTLPFVKSVFVRGQSEGGSAASLELKVVVCGNEKAKPKTTEPELIVFDSGSGVHRILEGELRKLYEFDSSGSHPRCAGNSYFRLSEDTSCTNLTATITPQIKAAYVLRIKTDGPFPETSPYLCLISKGKTLAAKQLKIEVCGSEVITANPRGFESETERSSIKASFDTYQSLFSSSSSNCGIRKYTLYQLGEAEPSLHDGSVFELDESDNLLVDVSQVGQFTVLIEGAGLASKAYLPVKITVTESSAVQEAIINMPPQFTHPPESVKVGSSEKKKTIDLPEVVDPLSNYCGLYVKVPSLGKAFISNSSAVSSWMGATSDSDRIHLQLDPPSLTVENIEESRGKVVSVQIQLVDSLAASSTYVFELTIEDGKQLNTKEGPLENNEGDTDDNLSLNEESEESDESRLGDKVIGPASSGTMPEDFFRLIMDRLQQESEVESKEEVQLSIVTLMEISRDGRVFFQFNQEFFIPFDAADLPTVNLPRDIARVRIVQAEETEGLAFSANLEAWEADHLIIRLNFSEPLLISLKAKPDILEVNFRDPSLFISKRSRRPIGSSYLLHTAALPRQFPSGVDPVSVETAAKVAEGSLLVLSIIQLGLQAILKGLMNDLWGLFFSLQLVCYTQLFVIAYPANAEIFLQSFRNLIEFKALKPDAIVGLIWGPEMTAKKLIYTWMGISESPSEVFTLGKTVFEELQVFIAVGLVALVGLIVALFLSLFNKLRPKIEAKLQALKAKMIWSGLIRSVTISYCSICILAKSKAEGFLGYGEGSMIEPIVIYIVALSFPLLFAAIVTTHRARLREERFSTKYGILTDSLWLREGANPWSTTGAWHFSLLLARRWLLCALPIIFFSWPALQLQGLMALTMAFSGAYFLINPHADPIRRRVERANQLLVCMATYTMISFSDLQPDPMKAFSAGYWLLGFLVGLLAVNVTGMVANILRRLRRKRKLNLLKALAWSQRGRTLSPGEAILFRASASESEKLAVEKNLENFKPQRKPKVGEKSLMDLSLESVESISSSRGALALQNIWTPQLQQDGSASSREGEQFTFEAPPRSKRRKKALTNLKKKGKVLKNNPESLNFLENSVTMACEPSSPLGVKLKAAKRGKKSKRTLSRKQV